MNQICVRKLTIIGSENGLSLGRHQTIIWTNAGILLNGTLGSNFSEIWSEIHTFSFTKMHLNISSAKWRQICLGLNVLTVHPWPVNPLYCTLCYHRDRKHNSKYKWEVINLPTCNGHGDRNTDEIATCNNAITLLFFILDKTFRKLLKIDDT